MNSDTTEYDIIIVGAGTAGCVIASRLSETNLRILLLEAGPDNNDDPKITTPLRSRTMFGDAQYDWDYRTTPQKHTNDRIFHQTRGRVLGGSSAINSHSLVYPNQAMHDTWAELAGDNTWCWAEMQRYYRKFQTVQDAERKPFAINGPIQASLPRHLNKLQVAWQEAFDVLGSFYHGNAADGKAIGGTTTTNAIDSQDGKGERSHAGNAYLGEARKRKNLTIVTDARAQKIHVNHDHGNLRATGVWYEKHGRSVLVRAHKEVVRCAGAFGSPQLLEVSGIGNRNVLDEAGVECLLDLPGVGENLQDHLNFGPSIQVKSSIETLDELSRNQSAADAAQEEYNMNRTGVLSEGAVYSFAYWPLQLFQDPTEEVTLQNAIDDAGSASTPLLEAQFEFSRRMLLDPDEASATVAMIPVRRYKLPGDSTAGNYVTLVAMLSHPFSRGSTHISARDSAVPPVIDLNYLSHPLDLEVLTRHVVQIERFVTNSKFQQVIEPNGTRYPENIGKMDRSQEELEHITRKHSATNYHPCGTCAMASSSLGGVVDANLLVHGLENLRVCDASIFPIIPRGNILSGVYAVAEKGAEIIAGI